MNNKNKKWVYECLVENETDPVGLIAYALYKKSKHDIAVEAREDGRNEAEIQEMVNNHHQSVLRSQHVLENFNTQATILLQDIYDTIRVDVEAKLQKAHDKRITELERAHNRKVKELEKAERVAFNQAAQRLKDAARQYMRPNIISRSFKWLWNGFSGVFAALIVALLVGGVIYYTSTEAQRTQAKEEAVRAVLDTLSGGS